MSKKAVVSQLRPHQKYERLIAAAKRLPAFSTAVVHPCDETSLRGALEAAKAGMIVPILVGPKGKILSLAKSLSLEVDDIEIVDVPHSQAAADKAVELVRTGIAELLMKGSLHSDELLGGVTKREPGLRTGRRISHVFVMDVPTHPQTLFITDAAVNIAPDLPAKRDIIQNAIDLFAGLGLGTPKVAIFVRGRDGDTQHPIDDRGCSAVQDGGARSNHWRRT
jgi:phosphate acetyltransferase